MSNTTIKQGYKQTEVGLIPEDWDVKQLGNIAKVNMGQSPLSSNYNSIGLGLPLVQGNADIRDRKTIIRNYTTQITKSADIGDIIMSVRAPVGEVAKSTLNCCIGRGVCSIKYSNEYIYQFLLNFEKSWSKFSTGSTFESVNSGQVKSLQIPLPPTLEEQKAIATALSDVDELITNLDKLITKKKAIKQGAMQQLLTPPHKGGKRLEGFSGEWVEKTVGEIAEYKNGTAHENCVVENGDFIIVNSKFVSTEGKVVKYSNKNLSPVNKAEILMVLSDIPNGKAIAKCYFVEEDNKYTLNQRICSFKTDKVDARFLFLLLNRNPYYLQFDDGVKQTNLRNEDVLSCPICIPPSKKEQEQISTIIFDLQKDIELAIRKKEKYQSIKQGMMQELLTGKTRLV